MTLILKLNRERTRSTVAPKMKPKHTKRNIEMHTNKQIDRQIRKHFLSAHAGGKIHQGCFRFKKCDLNIDITFAYSKELAKSLHS